MVSVVGVDGARVVFGVERLTFLLQFFDVHTGRLVEAAVDQSLRHLSPDYQGMVWNYYAVRGDGFFLAPIDYGQAYRIQVADNEFAGRFGAFTTGIVGTLFGCEYLVSLHPELDEVIQPHAQCLRDYARSLPNGAEILRAVS